MTNFVIVENPGISIRKACKISRIITQRHLSDLFFLYMRFLVLIILAFIPAGLGFLILLPYIRTAKANAYTYLKTEAVRSGFLTPADFA